MTEQSAPAKLETKKPEFQPRVHFEVQTQVERITPQQAAKYLGVNYENRTQRAQTIAAYGRDIENDEWMLTGETIIFDWFGNLIDGQHRLEACLSSGKSIDVIVVRGIDPDARNRIDAGIPRSFSDQLRFKRYAEPFALAATVRRVYLYEEREERSDFTSGKVTHAELEHALETHPELIEIVATLAPTAKKVGLSTSLLAFILWLLKQHNSEEADRFVELWAEGANLEKGSPILLLRDKIFTQKTMVKRVEFQTRALWLALTAWNHWRQGKTLTKLQLPKNGLGAENFPRIRS